MGPKGPDSGPSERGRPPRPSSPSAPGGSRTGAPRERADRFAQEPAEDEELVAQHLDELRRQLVSAPAEVVVANHAYGLFELAAMHLSEQPPRLDEARLAIDAMASIVEGLAGRLGEPERSLKDALSQIRIAFVQIGESSQRGRATSDPGS